MVITTRKPAWLKAKIPGGEAYAALKKTVREHQLHTVCESASCPNLGECWSQGTATVMILGNVCTRGCKFCDVPKGRPESYDREEPARVAVSASLMKLRYLVITSVTRDELPDQGAEVWADTLQAVREAIPGIRIEALIPDMQGRTELLDIILQAGPDVLNHNFETVARLQRKVRGRGNVETSSRILAHAKKKGFVTKTSFMLGLGETQDEVLKMIDLAADLQVNIVTFGQYLQPSTSHLPVERYVTPEEFRDFEQYSLRKGIPRCHSGPLVRSSYHARAQAADLFAG